MKDYEYFVYIVCRWAVLLKPGFGVVMPEHVHLMLGEPQRRDMCSDGTAPLKPKAGLSGPPTRLSRQTEPVDGLNIIAVAEYPPPVANPAALGPTTCSTRTECSLWGSTILSTTLAARARCRQRTSAGSRSPSPVGLTGMRQRRGTDLPGRARERFCLSNTEDRSTSSSAGRWRRNTHAGIGGAPTTIGLTDTIRGSQFVLEGTGAFLPGQH